MNVIYKFNNSNGATICNECRTIIAIGKRVERFYCDKCQSKLNEALINHYEIMNKLEIVNQEVNYGRNAIMWIEDDFIRFDTSDKEYGYGEISIKDMIKILDKYDGK